MANATIFYLHIEGANEESLTAALSALRNVLNAPEPEPSPGELPAPALIEPVGEPVLPVAILAPSEPVEQSETVATEKEKPVTRRGCRRKVATTEGEDSSLKPYNGYVPGSVDAIAAARRYVFGKLAQGGQGKPDAEQGINPKIIYNMTRYDKAGCNRFIQECLTDFQVEQKKEKRASSV